MERSDILERVKKLLALSKSNNLNEAEVALEKAQELMVAHHITEAEAMAQGGTGDPFQMGSTCLTKGKCIRLWRKMLAVWIAESCNCATIVRSVPGAGMAEAAIIPLGTATDLSLCYAIFTFADLEITRLGLHCCDMMGAKYRKSWHLGAVEGFKRALDRAKSRAQAKAFAMAEHLAGPAASAALVSIQKKRVWELETFKRDQLTDPSKPVPKAKPVEVDHDAFMDGLNAGMGIQFPGARALHPPTRGAVSMGQAV